MMGNMRKSLESKILGLYKSKSTWKENEHLEFKSGERGLPNSLWETYSAFANTSGGIIIVGVRDNGTIEGISQSDKRLQDFTNNINNPGKCSINLCTAAIITIDEKEVLAIEVSPATPEQKPVFLNNNPMNCFSRQNEGDFKCKESAVQRMIRDRDTVSSNYSADSELLPHTGLDDLDPQTLRQFRNRVRSGTPTNTWVDDDDDEFLRKIGAFKRDRATGQCGLTLAGLLMFGKTEAIQEFCPFFKIDYFEYGDDTLEIQTRWIDRVTIDGTWVSNLYQFFFKVLPLLTSGLKRPFKLSDELTRIDEPPAHIAVREALANAIIHADFREKFGIRIAKRSTGLELSNAGTLLLNKQQIFEGGFSLCRNKALQRMFKLMGVVDEAGSGVDKIVKGWTEQCLSFPDVKEDKDIPCVTWILPYLSLVPRQVQEAQLRFMGAEKYIKLTAWEKILLLLIPANQFVSSKELREYFPLHQADMGKILSKLRDEGYLQDSGKSNAKKYCLADKLGQEVAKAYSETHFMAPKNEFMAPRDDFMAPRDDFMAPKIPSAASEGPTLSAHERVIRELGIPSKLEGQIEEYRGTTRQNPKVTMSLILDICRTRWVTALQLSILLNREVRPLRKNFLQPAILCRKLEHLHPASPKNKHQAYRTVE